MTEFEPRRGSVLISGVGASQGVGGALARRFAREGYPVVIAGRSADKLNVTLNELQNAGANAVVALGDSTNAADLRRFVDMAETLAPLAIAIHNAGANEPAPFLKVSEERFTRHWREHALGGCGIAPAGVVQQGGDRGFHDGPL